MEGVAQPCRTAEKGIRFQADMMKRNSGSTVCKGICRHGAEDSQGALGNDAAKRVASGAAENGAEARGCFAAYRRSGAATGGGYNVQSGQPVRAMDDAVDRKKRHAVKASGNEGEAIQIVNTDEELYAGFLCGEDDALRQLMDRHMERLVLFCFTFLHSAAEAEEMALDAFAVVAMKQNLWRGGSFQGWLYRIARNLSISRYRSIRRIQASFDEAHHLSVSSAETVYLQQEEKQAILSLLRNLPEKERQVLTLLYQENASYTQAARFLGISEKQVDNLAYRGKKKLREWLRREDG